ncbi:MAG: PD-(D/E)XK nuclease family protein [Thermodesulfobacteriota bacterium]|nr:PD-(D/E)XK nuclease family protein [Thermodesulfobacteriota bacterium]
MNAYKSIYAAAASGAVLVTVNRRLARTLHDGYARRQQSRGCQVWEQPAIFTLETWLRRCLAALGEEGRLLTPAQSDCLWQQMIRTDLDKHDLGLMQVQATSRLAAQAHRLVSDAQCVGQCAVSSPLFDLSPEHQAFLRWQSAYLLYCEQKGWLDTAALTGHIIQALSTGNIFAPSKFIFLGFDELNPVQTCLQQQLEALGTTVEVVVPESAPEVELDCYSCRDEMSEILAAAKWARQQLEDQVGTVAVVVPDLARLQGAVERIFRRELQRSLFPQRVAAQTFNVSLGNPLHQQGMVATALELLGVGYSVELDTISYLLRSPWLAGGVTEAGARAQLERWLRQQNVREISLSALIKLCRQRGDSPRSFTQLLLLLRDARSKTSFNSLSKSAPRSLVQWGDHFNQLLQQAGWPGERALTSEDFQTLSAWRDKLLPALAELSAVHPATDRSTALNLLRKLAMEQLFQPKAQDDRLQVTGILETAGLHFDALWVMGLTDQVLPGRVQHNPFLPVELQRQHRMPHSSVQHENDFAKLTMQRLISAAPQVVLSYPCRDGDMSLRPSPFMFAHLPDDYTVVAVDEDMTPEAKLIDLESLVDEVGVALNPAEAPHEVQGGTAIIKEQALCPFRAYAHYRLKVRALESPQAGFDSRLRGDLVHKVLERFWSQITSHQQLCALSAVELEQLLAKLTQKVLEQVELNEQATELLAIEQQRLTALIVDWLQQFEQLRTPFTVVAVEQRKKITLGALVLTAVPDRVDCLPDNGGQVVIDYKSGAVSNGDLVGAQLLEPQLPIYALKGFDGGQGQVVAVTFAQLRVGECAFKGVAASDGIIAGVKSVEKSLAAKRDIYDWAALLADWEQQLERLASEFAAGQAQVLPVKVSACQFCDLSGLCRIAARDGEE